MLATLLAVAPGTAGAGYGIDNPSPWGEPGDDPRGRVRYDGSCDSATCSWFIRLEVYYSGKWWNWQRTNASGSAHNRSLYTTTPGSYCPLTPIGAHGITASYRTEFYMKITNLQNHTISANVGGSFTNTVVQIVTGVSGTYDILASQSKNLWHRSNSNRVTCD